MGGAPLLRCQEDCWPTGPAEEGKRSGISSGRSLFIQPPVTPSPPRLWAQDSPSCGRAESPHPSLCPPQCLNAVRTVQSLACLEEADHTVGFLLQLSSFRKEWHFHLPQLMRDVQVGPETSFLGVWGQVQGEQAGREGQACCWTWPFS